MTDAPKLLPRNLAALRAGQGFALPVIPIAGNPVSTRLESGIGNFYPGLECDLRNLERRFFPFLEVDLSGQADRLFTTITIVAVDLDGASSAQSVSPTDLDTYRTLDRDTRANRRWRIRAIKGDFGPLNQRTVTIAQLDGMSFANPDDTSLHPPRPPADGWVAIRMLKENTPVTLTLMRDGAADKTITAPRMPYLDPNGSFARMFEPGELTQSLCSPWTHDFRDCACNYWASNHPDIALPPLPSPPPPVTERRWQKYTAWERAERSISNPPVATAEGAGAVAEMAHNRINRDWQQLNFVLDHREQLLPYIPKDGGIGQVQPLRDRETLIRHLRFAAGVELGVALEYLVAAWSIRRPDDVPEAMRDDVLTAFAEFRRIAIGEMRHLRAVNDVLLHLQPIPAFEPALAVASRIPDGSGSQTRAHIFRAATGTTIDDFIQVEKPSDSVDGLYAPIFVTLAADNGSQEQAQSIRTIMSEGENHFQTFQFIKEWLGRHRETDYLIGGNLVAPPPTHPAHRTLQTRYRALLEGLHRGYKAGMPRGAPLVNDARDAMLGQGGIQGALDGVAAAGFLASFDPIDDPRFKPIDPP
jgi:hypothetical protein